MKGKLPASRAEANFDARLNIISQTLTLHDKKNISRKGIDSNYDKTFNIIYL